MTDRGSAAREDGVAGSLDARLSRRARLAAVWQRAGRPWGQAGAALVGAAGLAVYAGLRLERTLVPAPWACAAVGAALLVVGILDLAGRVAGRARGVESVARGISVAWPAWLFVAALPGCLIIPHLKRPVRAEMAAAVLVCACGVLVFRARRAGVALVAQRLRGQRVGAWELALLGLTLMVGALYVKIAAASRGSLQNDAAYYFGVARHMAETHRFEEPIVWHFLRPPETVPHAPFDYWGGLTCVVLAPVLAVFGPTQPVAFVTMALISAASLVALWYLVCVAAPVRHAAVQLFALTAFAFAPLGQNYRFDTESLPLFHLLAIVSLIGLLTDRPILATVTAFLLVWTRADGVLLFAAIVLACVGRILWKRKRERATPIRESEGGDSGRVESTQGPSGQGPSGQGQTGPGALTAHEPRRHALSATVGTAVALFAVAVFRNWFSFGTLLPPGAAGAPWVKDQLDLYALHARPSVSVDAVVERLGAGYLADRVRLLVEAFTELPLVSGQRLFVGIVVVSVVAAVCRRRLTAAVAIQALFLGVLFAVTWASGPLFQEWRTVSAFLPLLVLAMALGMSSGIDLLARPRWRNRRRLRRAWLVVACAAVLATGHVVFTDTALYGSRGKAAMLTRETALRDLDATLGGAPVMATEPWYAMAYTHSPVVSIPEDGEASMIEVMKRYGIRWIIVVYDYRWMRKSAAPMGDLARGARQRLGPFDIAPVAAPPPLRVFSVTPVK